MIRACKTGAALALFVALGTPAPAEITPAELPPAGYGGMQYVDSRGCAFIRAGTEGEVLWIPRVSAGGVPQCGFPPSGNRVPIAGEPGADMAVFEPDAAAAKPAASDVPAGSGGFIIAVGSFGVAGNADKAEARLTALGYPASRRSLQGGSSALVTVFAGPFESAEDANAARTALRAAGFPDAVMLSL